MFGSVMKKVWLKPTKCLTFGSFQLFHQTFSVFKRNSLRVGWYHCVHHIEHEEEKAKVRAVRGGQKED